MPIEIRINGENASQVLFELRELSSGLTPQYVVDTVNNTVTRLQSSTKIAEQEVAAAQNRLHDVPAPSEDDGAMRGQTPEQIAGVKRERGMPASGRARRTKEEIAEDATWYVAQGQSEATDESGESAGMSISSGNERIDPEDEATAEADAADEAAETAATGGLAPRERLRKALGALGIKAGVEAVKPGGLLGMTVNQVPDDEIEAVIAKLETAKQASADYQAVLKEPAKQADVKVTLKAATKDDLMQAMLDYAEIYDGTRNPADAKLAQVDAGKVFELLFGEGINKLSTVPSDGYDKAIAGIKEAIAKNPFKRERKG